MQILVVEDQNAIRSMIESLVSGRGHEVVGVSTGTKAIEAAFRSPPDLVFLDLHLPGKHDGFDVCEKLRSNESTKRVPIIIVSARDDTAARTRAMALGATAFYGKPFSPTALLKEVEKLGRAAKG